MSLLYFVVRVRCRRKESSRSLSHLLMIFLLVEDKIKRPKLVNTGMSEYKLTTNEQNFTEISLARVRILQKNF